MLQLRIALVAPSGSGKSTVAGLLKKYFESIDLNVDIVKLAAPLYRLQSQYYAEASRSIESNAQDQVLLEEIAVALRRINPGSLVENFYHRLVATSSQVVINDDLRDDANDWPKLRSWGFYVVKISTSVQIRRARLIDRLDKSVKLASPLDAQIERIHPDFTIENDGSIEALKSNVIMLAAQLLSMRKTICGGLTNTPI